MTVRRLPTVREFMDRYVETVSPEIDIMEAVDFLLEKRVTGALVANSRKELVDILTEFDRLELLTLGDAHHEAPRGKVKDFMMSAVQAIPPTHGHPLLCRSVHECFLPPLPGGGGRPHRGRDYALRSLARRATQSRPLALNASPLVPERPHTRSGCNTTGIRCSQPAVPSTR